ncbi:MAG: LysM peptidoglycan-binding domain-containing protein [Deltaproteobacteria bacterium]|nr:LysM peptidoglycan-binding domain-containing protein [Deltaproteobacteria bacterium]
MSDRTDNRYKEEAVPEFLSGMVDELEYIPRNERLGRAGRLKRSRNMKWLLAIAIAALILIVVLATAFEDKEEGADSLEASLARIEERLATLETKIARIENLSPELHENGAASTRSSSRERYHIVSPGDTLSGIAGKYGLTVQVLCKLNQLTVDQPIKPGQKLLVSPD